MSKEEYYSKIKRFVYRKFEELKVRKRNDGNDIYLNYNDAKYDQIIVNKNSGYVYYYSEYKNKICYMIGVNQVDFEILLKYWIEDTFKMEVKDTPIELY